MSRWMTRLLVLSVLLPLAACQTARRENIEPPKELQDFTATAQVQRLWSRDVGDVGGKPGLAMTATHADGRLYVANTRGDLLVLDANGGREIDRYRTGHAFASSPGVGEGAIAVGTLDGRLVVLDQASGNERFVVSLSSEVIAAPVLAEGRVFVRSHDGRTSAFNLADGSVAWVQEHPVPPLSLRGNASPRYDRGYLLVPHDDGRLVAMRADDGTPVWQQQVGVPDGRTDLERLADVDGEVAIADGVAYAVGYEGQAMAIDIAAGTPIWTRDLSAATGVGLGDRVFVSAADGTVSALDRSNGDVHWTQDALERRWLSTPAVVGGFVAVGDFDGYIHLLNPSDGSLAARARVARSAVRAAPFAIGEVVYVMATDGTLAAYRVGS